MPLNRPALKAHVASDHTSGSHRQFVFTPTGPDNKSRAAVVLNEHFGRANGERKRWRARSTQAGVIGMSRYSASNPVTRTPEQTNTCQSKPLAINEHEQIKR